MQEMEPQRRLGGSFVRPRQAEHDRNLCIARRRNDCREVHRYVQLQLIDLRLLRQEIRAEPLAMRVALARNV